MSDLPQPYRDARQRIAEQTKHIRNRQERAVARFNLWAKEPVK